MVQSMCKDSKVGLKVRKYCPRTCGVCKSDFLPLTADGDRKISSAVKLWFSNRTAAMDEYGHISQWDVSQITNMGKLFEDRADFNEDLSQ